MKLFIKNMVSERCKALLKDELEKLHITYNTVDLGVADIAGITAGQQIILNSALEHSGLGIIVDKRRILIEQLKTTIVQLVHYSDDQARSNLSVHLSEKLGYDYTYLANIFSEAEGITLEKFMIAHKIERVKELLFNGDLTLTEIANRLHYSSVSHLSRQFKKVTGITPSIFRSIEGKNRISLENV
jgi:AraC-like DNA-binding protein